MAGVNLHGTLYAKMLQQDMMAQQQAMQREQFEADQARQVSERHANNIAMMADIQDRDFNRDLQTSRELGKLNQILGGDTGTMSTPLQQQEADIGGKQAQVEQLMGMQGHERDMQKQELIRDRVIDRANIGLEGKKYTADRGVDKSVIAAETSLANAQTAADARITVAKIMAQARQSIAAVARISGANDKRAQEVVDALGKLSSEAGRQASQMFSTNKDLDRDISYLAGTAMAQLAAKIANGMPIEQSIKEVRIWVQQSKPRFPGDRGQAADLVMSALGAEATLPCESEGMLPQGGQISPEDLQLLEQLKANPELIELLSQ
jgi:hypothetical protein